MSNSERTRPEVVGIPWFLEADYGQARDMMLDSERLPDTYRRWLEEAEALERQTKASGRAVTRAIIDPFEFSIWCRDMNLKPDGAARQAFAAWVASRQDEGY